MLSDCFHCSSCWRHQQEQNPQAASDKWSNVHIASIPPTYPPLHLLTWLITMNVNVVFWVCTPACVTWSLHFHQHRYIMCFKRELMVILGGGGAVKHGLFGFIMQSIRLRTGTQMLHANVQISTSFPLHLCYFAQVICLFIFCKANLILTGQINTTSNISSMNKTSILTADKSDSSFKRLFNSWYSVFSAPLK